MGYTLSILDLLRIDKNVLDSKGCNFALYSGLSQQDIPKGTVFNLLLDKESGLAIDGRFTIEYIQVLGKDSDFVMKGYHAVLFISSDVEMNYLKKRMLINQEGNFKNLCYLTTEFD